MSNDNKDRLAEILPQLNANQLRYLAVRHDCSSDLEAASALGIKVNTIYDWPPVVKEALNLMLHDGVVIASEILRRNSSKAAAIKAAGLDSEEERIRQDSASEILDRTLGKPMQRNEISGPDGTPLFVGFGEDVEKL
jgi:hypothetical protein